MQAVTITTTIVSSTTKTGRLDMAEILLKVALNTINQIKSYPLEHRNVLCNFQQHLI
jgi:hypothetical protein